MEIKPNIPKCGWMPPWRGEEEHCYRRSRRSEGHVYLEILSEIFLCFWIFSTSYNDWQEDPCYLDTSWSRQDEDEKAWIRNEIWKRYSRISRIKRFKLRWDQDRSFCHNIILDSGPSHLMLPIDIRRIKTREGEMFSDVVWEIKDCLE